MDSEVAAMVRFTSFTKSWVGQVACALQLQARGSMPWPTVSPDSPCHSWFYYFFTITTSIALRTRTNALSVCGISNPHDNRAMYGYGAINRLCPQVLGL